MWWSEEGKEFKAESRLPHLSAGRIHSLTQSKNKWKEKGLRFRNINVILETVDTLVPV